MQDWIIDSKLAPPPGSGKPLRRERLLSRLHGCAEGGVCLIHAAAGYGKTAILARWYEDLEDNGIPVAWLSLDERDGHLKSFLTYLAAACRQGGFSEFQSAPLSDLGTLSEEDATLAVLTSLSRLKGRHVLVLDDVHRSAGKSVEVFLDRLAHTHLHNLMLVLSSRSLPEHMAIADLRVGGELEELTQQDLCFDLTELQALFAENAASPRDLTKWLQELQHRTEGWPVAVGTVLRWTREGASPPEVLERLSGRDVDLSEYFLEQAFADLSNEEQTFLLSTSILERVNGDISNTLYPDADGWKLLRGLEKRDAFVQRADSEGNWYRYHRLYTEFLAERLRRSATLEQKTLHRAAAHWFRQQDLLTEAVHHTMAAGDLRTCAELLESLGGWQFALRGDLALVQTVLKQLSIRDLADYPRLWLARIYLSVRVGHHRAGVEDLKRFLSETSERRKSDELLQCETALIETLVQRYTDNPVTSQSIERLERLADQLPPDNEVLQAVRANFLCAMYREISEYELSEIHAKRALEHYRLMGATYAEVFIYFHQGVARMRQARFGAAESCYEEGLSIALKVFGADSDLAAIGRIFLAECYYERARVDEAAQLLDRSLGHAERADAWLEVYVAGFCTLLRIAYESGDMLLQERVFTRAQLTASRRQLPRLASLTALQDQELALRHNRPGQSALAEQETDPGVGWDLVSKEFSVAVQARTHLLEGHWDEARNALREPLGEAKRTGFFRAYIHFSLLLAATEWQAGQRAAAVEAFESAVSMAMVEDARQVFVEDAPLLLPLLEQILDGGNTSAIAPARLAFLRKLRADMQTHPRGDMEDQCVLSPREIEILRCLMMGESNREIASSKSLSVNTVKFHLKNIFSKLGAASRDEAVAFAIRDQLI